MGRYVENFSPPIVWNLIPKQLSDTDRMFEKKNPMDIPRKHNLLHSVGPRPASTKNCLILCSTLREKREKTDKQTLWLNQTLYLSPP